ncbi:MAG: hypothetical protein JEY79_05490 [Pseudodesulfovibrio sp.]|nr:hypothetical protein [Pseudodesulfovibrio sp.]
MGFALDRLGPAECCRIAESLLTSPKPQSDRIWSDCPHGHEQSKNQTASWYKPDVDQWKCHSCGEYGDLISIYAIVNNLEAGSPEAFRAFASEFVPGWEADGEVPIRRKTVPKPQPDWHGAPPDMPPALWSSKAGEFVDSCVAALPESKTARIHLSDHGINLAIAQQYHLGWNDHDRYYPVTSWGLPFQEGAKGERKIWLPAGLVIPTYFQDRVAKLKIRRDGYETGPIKLRDRKYWEGFGGSKLIYVVLGNPEKVRVWIIVETERDAYTLMRAVSMLPWTEHIGAVATCGSGKRPDAEAEKFLRRAALILNSLDTDNSGRENSFKFWAREFPNSIRWPVPSRYGKDVGDAVMPLRFAKLKSSSALDRFDWLIMDSMYLDIAAWIEAGLPHHVRRELDSLIPVLASLPSPAPSPEKPYFDQVLELLETMPLWRDELESFRDFLKANTLKIFMTREGRPWVGCSDVARYKDQEVGAVVFQARQRFHDWRVLDEWVGKGSLEDIVIGYFNGRLEVRG